MNELLDQTLVHFGNYNLTVGNVLSALFLGNEFIKSDLRFALNELFIKHHIQIPFPQRELWINHPEQGAIESPI